MVRISEDLLRKKAEHNDGVLSTLRELALHQEGIDKIELLNQACRHLTALYLQNNIIERIENLHRLKASIYVSLSHPALSMCWFTLRPTPQNQTDSLTKYI